MHVILSEAKEPASEGNIREQGCGLDSLLLGWSKYGCELPRCARDDRGFSPIFLVLMLLIMVMLNGHHDYEHEH